MSASPKLLLIGWDAGEWAVIRPLMNAGLMPNLLRLIETGCSGNLAASQPLISPIVWTSIVTGKRPMQHGVLGYCETRPDKLDVRPVGSYSRKCKAIWNILSQRGLRTLCINAPASSPAEPINGVFVSREFVEAGRDLIAASRESSVHPASRFAKLQELRIEPAAVPADLLTHLLPDADAMRSRDAGRLEYVAAALSRTASTQAIACDLLATAAWDFAAVFYSGIEMLSHAFMQYHPPKLEAVTDNDFARFSEVITKTYRLHDLMLGRLRELAGDEAHVLVVSDHGFVTGKSRSTMTRVKNVAEASSLHRPQGIFAMAGPSVMADELIEGATIYDIVPTILSIFDLPSARDMEGRTIATALRKTSTPQLIDSWEAMGGDSGRLPPEPPPPTEESVRYLSELGYKELPTRAAQRQIERVHDDNAFNVACSLISSRRAAQAVPLLERLVSRHPANSDYARMLFEAYLSQGRLADARRVVQTAADRGLNRAMQQIGFALVALAEDKPSEALSHLRQANPAELFLPEVNLLIGKAYLRMKQWSAADEAFGRELQESPECEEALAGQAAVAIQSGDGQAAAELALKAVGLRGDFSDAHYLLGTALAMLDRPHDAAVALRRCITLDPCNVMAIEALAALLADRLQRPNEARELQLQAITLRHQQRVLRTDFAASMLAH